MNILQFWPQLLSGVAVTIKLMLSALVLGFFLASVLTALAESGCFFLKWLVNVFVFIICGTPLLIQIFIIYYGSGQFHWLLETILWSVLRKPFGCAVVTLAINTSAYTTVLLLSAIRSVPTGEIEAAKALGLSRWKVYQKIIIARAIRIVLPAYSNEVSMILKGTSLASTITLMDVMGVIRHLVAMTYDIIPFFLLAGIIYFILNTLITGVFYFFEKN